MPKKRGSDGQWIMGGRKPPESFRENKRRWAKKTHANLRAELLQAYGEKCWCCGETEKKFLTLDHLHNDGYKERRSYKSGIAVYGKLKKQGWPQEGYALACYNCNCGRAHNGGVCPHQEITSAT